MVVRLSDHPPRKSGFAGLRLSAEEYFALPEDGNRYELIDGVVVMSPSPTPKHQNVASEILVQLRPFVLSNRLGVVLPEVDICLGRARDGGPLVYRPELVFVGSAKAKAVRERVEVVPDAVIEVVSPSSRGLDTETKFHDYQQAGVGEYWLIDPIEERMTFYRLRDGTYVEMPQQANRFASEVVVGFQLQLDLVRECFRAFG
ncbi:MAG: Uma2 family endonuclease [Phycisphaerae bacterium]